jgi:hypothetical protein
LEVAVASDEVPLMVEQNWKRSCNLSRCRPVNRGGAGEEEAMVDDTRALGRRARIRVDTAISPRRHKLRPNLGHVCVPTDMPLKMRRTVGLGFFRPGQEWTDQMPAVR